ncbi:hypothetical protein BH23PAT1_BH23PAT1_0320 [soil metagenome]
MARQFILVSREKKATNLKAFHMKAVMFIAFSTFHRTVFVFSHKHNTTVTEC